MIAQTIRKSTLALILVLIIGNAGKAFARSTPPAPGQRTVEFVCPGGGNPDPCNGGTCLVAIH